MGGRALPRRKPRLSAGSRSLAAVHDSPSPARQSGRLDWSWSRGVATVDLGLADPVPESLGVDPELLTDSAERSRPRDGVLTSFDGHPRGAVAELIGVLPCCWHALHPSVGTEPPPAPGRYRASRTITPIEASPELSVVRRPRGAPSRQMPQSYPRRITP